MRVKELLNRTGVTQGSMESFADPGFSEGATDTYVDSDRIYVVFGCGAQAIAFASRASYAGTRSFDIWIGRGCQRRWNMQSICSLPAEHLRLLLCCVRRLRALDMLGSVPKVGQARSCG
jgi:hypothetical protein